MLERDPKRRRLAPVNAPFRSPLRRPSTPTSQSQSDASSLPSSSSTANTTPQRPRLPRQFKSPVFARNDERGVTPEVLALIHQKRDLEAAIKAEMKAIETAELALKYEKQVALPSAIPLPSQCSLLKLRCYLKIAKWE